MAARFPQSTGFGLISRQNEACKAICWQWSAILCVDGYHRPGLNSKNLITIKKSIIYCQIHPVDINLKLSFGLKPKFHWLFQDSLQIPQESQLFQPNLPQSKAH
ncbi:hypothetical protein O181_031936 [Austropuccinia psidii MF-1]|uniref:Uncharacterized protein n=1 Tax=Austropuccinia psidii MF-1 TaxID=1389203 RepID=A0A9Q3H5P4_9BASI|nr:hypothetical protein [Austropuccinia psidii MF-1]